MVIKILGAGCDKCDKAYKNVKEAIEELNVDVKVEKVEDLVTMVKYGVMTTPGIVVDEKVVLVGKIPSVNDFKEIIKQG